MHIIVNVSLRTFNKHFDKKKLPVIIFEGVTGYTRRKTSIRKNAFTLEILWNFENYIACDKSWIHVYSAGLEFLFFPEEGSLPTNIYEWRGVEIFGRDKKNTFDIL